MEDSDGGPSYFEINGAGAIRGYLIMSCDPLNITNRNVLHEIAYSLVQWGRYQKAHQFYTRAIDLNPRGLGSYLGRAQSYMAAKKFDSAWIDCETAISIDPTISLPYYLQGKIAAKRLETKTALQFYQKAKTLEKKDTNLYKRILDGIWECLNGDDEDHQKVDIL